MNLTILFSSFTLIVFIIYLNVVESIFGVHCKISSGCVDLLALIFSYCSIKKTES